MIVVAPAAPAHADSILALTEEMDSFYGATKLAPIAVRREQLNEALFGEQPSAHVLLAWDDDRLMGLAAYSFLWPAVGLTRSLFLKELYVAEVARRAGVGTQLMQELFRVAARCGCSRAEWHTESTNHAAQEFYGNLGVAQLPGKVLYRLET